MNIKIKQMEIDDIEKVVKIDSICFPVGWSSTEYKREILENEFAYLYVLKINEEIIGYIDFWITFDICQLTKIAILPEYRRQKYAHVLMDEMIKKAEELQCESISLEVRVSNKSAQRLYESYGFLKVNVRKGYYQDNGEDANYLIKPLGGGII